MERIYLEEDGKQKKSWRTVFGGEPERSWRKQNLYFGKKKKIASGKKK